MDRRRFLLTSLAGALAASRAADAQSPGHVRRLGYLSNSSIAVSERFVEAFRHGLRELGWVEGQNTVIEYRWAEGKSDRLPGLAAELVRLNADVIVAAPTPLPWQPRTPPGRSP